MRLTDEALHFLGLGQDPTATNFVTAIPGGGFQWRMELGDIGDLSGREFMFRGITGHDTLQFS